MTHQVLVQSVTNLFTRKRKSPEFTAHIFIIGADSYIISEGGSLQQSSPFHWRNCDSQSKKVLREKPGPEPRLADPTPLLRMRSLSGGT